MRIQEIVINELHKKAYWKGHNPQAIYGRTTSRWPYFRAHVPINYIITITSTEIEINKEQPLLEGTWRSSRDGWQHQWTTIKIPLEDPKAFYKIWNYIEKPQK